MNNNTSAQSGGIGLLGLLTILFVAPKLTGVIDWSWWWVLSPMLIPIGLFLAVAAFAIIMAIIFNRGDKR